MDRDNRVTDGAGSFSFDSLEALRKKLLDITSRNALLNFKHPKRSSLRIIDEIPDQLVETLQSGQEMTFIPVPEPTEDELVSTGYIEIDEETNEVISVEDPSAQEWAKELGLETSFDLPISRSASAKKHKDHNIQTLLYPQSLEATLRAIRTKAESSIEETGSNILYLAFGFLEWFESTDSNQKRMAPLFTLPVTLQRSKTPSKDGVFRYKVKATDDGIISNVTLRHKLYNDFGLELPLIKDSMLPEQYLNLVERKITKNKPRWKVKWQASLCLLNFSKQVMYQDLDPANWPAERSLTKHPIIAHLFGDRQIEVNKSDLHPEDYYIDSIPEVHSKFPIIDNADASQHSALVDAVDGKNLVVVGPPGTGKSQTITNMIAAMIANNKKILFVAEKMAALNVVKDRLEKAGLGDFCLELHSHKTNKQQIFRDFEHRLDKHNNFKKPKDIESEIAQYENYKEQLKKYCSAINREWKDTGRTVHEILTAVTRLRMDLGVNPKDLNESKVVTDKFSKVDERKLIDNADMYRNVYQEVSSQSEGGDIANHYWVGIQRKSLSADDKGEIVGLLEGYTGALSSVIEEWTEYFESEGFSNSSISLESIFSFIGAGEELPDLDGDLPLAVVPGIIANDYDVQEWRETYFKLIDWGDALGTVFNEKTVSDERLPEKIKVIKSLNEEARLHREVDSLAIFRVEREVKACQELAGRVISILEQMRSRAPEELSSCFSLSKAGVEEFRTLVKFIDQLPGDLWRHRDRIYDNSDIDPVLDEITDRLDVCVPVYNKIKDTVSLFRLPEYPLVEQHARTVESKGWTGWFSKEWRASRKEVRSWASNPKTKFSAIRVLLGDVKAYAKERDKIEELNSLEPLGNLYKGVETPIDKVSKLRSWYRSIREEYGAGFYERSRIADGLFDIEKPLAESITDAAKHGLLSDLEVIEQKIEKIYEITEVSRSDDDDWISVLDFYAESLPIIREKLSEITLKESISVGDVIDQSSNAGEYQKEYREWSESSITGLLSRNGLALSGRTEDKESGRKSIADAISRISIQALKDPLMSQYFRDGLDKEKYVKTKRFIDDLKPLAVNAKGLEEKFEEAGDISWEDWLGACGDSVQDILSRNQKAIDRPEWLLNWSEYIALKEKLVGKGLAQLIRKVEGKALPSGRLTDLVKLVINYQLADQIFQENSDIKHFNGLEQNAIRMKFREYDKRLMSLQRDLVAHRADMVDPPIGVSSGLVKDKTELSLIKHNIGLKRPKIAIRQLMERSGDSILDLKPCFMMSPMSVAQYLKPGIFEFDVVIMDEASQIRPEEALGAVARGAQLIVVGDPKQLPPTNFFNKAMNDDVDEELESSAQATDSILEAIEPIFRSRLLQWHYRSRHESLIEFSNRCFYDSKLVVFPSPIRESDEYGIDLVRVQNGRFLNQRNVEEAKKVAQAALREMVKFPEDSVGVVAMNVNQADEIERQFYQLVKDNPQFQTAYSENQDSKEPLFIKNLENVQGDERDVVIISMTYGPETPGASSMHQRFGPINSDVGWRRLNVLFTRSKKRMRVFSSMNSSHIVPTPNSKRGVLALKKWLQYCETSQIVDEKVTGKQPDSDFEIAVIEALKARGYDCVPQLGVSGYFIDIAVKDPGAPGRFLMGIECDGATYHSAKSTRDRDRLRQEVLESLDWRIRRIWSTDWFKNPDAQLEPIIQELEKLKTQPAVIEVSRESAPSGPQQLEFGVHEEEPDYSSDAETFLENERASDKGLRQILEDFDADVIRKQFTDTPEKQRLLRQGMIDALVHYAPCSKAEFLEVMPAYLREGSSRAEAKAYLEDVLELISNYS